MKSLQYLTFAVLALVGAKEVDYTSNGANWPKKYPGCRGSNQSPIDLSSKAKWIGGNLNEFEWEYSNFNETKVSFNNDYSTHVISVDPGAGTTKAADENYFKSKVGMKYFKTPSKFQALQFHFHSTSEHTVDGRYYDFEMHTVHLPAAGQEKNGFIAAALGVIFDTKNYNKNVTEAQVKAIDAFFDSLAWVEDEIHSDTEALYYGNLLNALDLDNRWIYKGSVTTPPCAKTVFWNVLYTVYPIKERHLKMYKQHLGHQKNQNIVKTGNHREIQKYSGHDLMRITNKTFNDAGGSPFMTDKGSSSFKFELDGNQVKGQMRDGKTDQGAKMSVKGDGFEVSMNAKASKTDPKTEFMEHRVKFDKYFMYGMDYTNMKVGSMKKMCQKTSDCDGKSYQKMCCVTAVMTNQQNGMQDQMYRCMNYRLAQANFEMKMDNFQVAMRCTDSESSAKYMTSALIASMISMILMALY